MHALQSLHHALRASVREIQHLRAGAWQQFLGQRDECDVPEPQPHGVGRAVYWSRERGRRELRCGGAYACGGIGTCFGAAVNASESGITSGTVAAADLVMCQTDAGKRTQGRYS